MSEPALNINALSSDERLRLIERLWDSLTQNPDEIPITNAQRSELDRRLDAIDDGDNTGIPWDEVLRQVRARTP